MLQATVTFEAHNPRQASGKHGPFTVHEFFTADGAKFETTKAEIANAAYALLNQPVSIVYTETQNGEWTNRRLSSVVAAGANAMAPGVLPSGSVPAPTGAAPASPQAATAPTTGGVRQADHPDTAKRIARSVGLELALKAAADGVVTVNSHDELFDVAHSFGAYVFNGSRPSSPAATGADSSGAGGGGDAGAAPAAPAATEAAPQTQPTDDIPF